jgi:hypothetical protein
MKSSIKPAINNFDGAGDVVTEGTSPASTGPAGAYFEGQVGASFLMSLLVGAEPRGLPGTTTDRVKLQRSAEGHPLDDVIVDAHDAQGNAAVLEVQVKRSITFAPTDPVFRDVVGQIAKVASKPEFLKGRYELAIATAQTSHKIEGPYQTVLTWARQLGGAATFMSRIKRPGSANDAMRSFVNTFRAHLEGAGAPHDDESVWRLLCRLQILPFDFTATGSAASELAKERATRALHPDDAPRAGDMVVEIGSRRILHGNVTAHPTAAWTLQQFREAVPGDHSYRFLIHDRDSIFSTEVDAELQAFGLNPRSPFFSTYRFAGDCQAPADTCKTEQPWVDTLGGIH